MIAALTLVTLVVAEVQPLKGSHAHNDYEHARPLLDAMEQGFTSFEADVFLVDGELRVAHDLKDTRPGRTLESLYLDPLQEIVAKNKGRVYRKGGPITLLVDIKRDGEAVYQHLKSAVLPKYKSWLTSFDGRVKKRAVTIILSGDRPIETVKAEKNRFVFIDGRLPDLKPGFDPKLMPLVSDSFQTVFKWTGIGRRPEEFLEKLKATADLAKKHKTDLRFWATPESPQLWGDLRSAGVTVIGTDRLADLAAFLRGNGQ